MSARLYSAGASGLAGFFSGASASGFASAEGRGYASAGSSAARRSHATPETTPSVMRKRSGYAMSIVKYESGLNADAVGGEEGRPARRILPRAPRKIEEKVRAGLPEDSLRKTADAREANRPCRLALMLLPRHSLGA